MTPTLRFLNELPIQIEPAVSEKLKRRWHQFSLRTLLASTFAIGLLLGVLGRVQFLSNQADFHEREYFRYIDIALEIHRNESLTPDNQNRSRDLILISQRHKAIAELYRRAVYRPWELVDESQLAEVHSVNTP